MGITIPDRTAERLSALGAVAAGLLVLGLQAAAIDRQSLIGDAPYHLLAGEQALRYGQNQLNLEHPPLVKLVAAWPLLDEEPLAPPVAMDRAIATSLRLFDDPARVRRAQIQARVLLLAVFGLPFLAGCYSLGRWWGGPRAGGVLAASLGLSFGALPFLPVVQTDTAVALGYAATLVAALFYLERATLFRASALGAGLGLALASKYSGLLLLPAVLLAIALADPPSLRGPAVPGRLRRAVQRSGHLAVLGLVAGGLVYVTYAVANRDYDPAIGRDTLERYVRGEGMITDDALERHEALIFAAERVDPNLAQWLTGLLGIRAQNEAGVYPSYAFGDLSSRGRWWYFPALLLLQTPIVLLVALGCSFARFPRTAGPPGERRGTTTKAVALLAVTAAVYLGVAMTSNYNLGVRHLLPILPILYLPAALWAAEGRIRSAVLVGVLALEAAVLAPLWMSSTNTSWADPFNPARLAFGSLEYHQNFRVLAGEARERGIEDLHVLYPLLRPEELGAYLPEARLLTPDAPPRPGWYAVNVLVEQYLPAVEAASPETLRGHRNLLALARTWTPSWEAIRRGEDHGWVAGTFHLFHLPEKDLDEPGEGARGLAVIP